MPKNNQPAVTEPADKLGKPVKQTRPGKSAAMSPQTEAGDNAKYLAHSLKLMELPKIDTDDPAALHDRIVEYFTLCAEDDMKPSVAGLALSLRVERQTLWRWKHETDKPEKCDTIKRAYQVLDVLMNDYMQNGKINPVSGIFLMKNNLGYTDKQEVIVTPKKTLDGDMSRSPEELRRMYVEQVAESGLPAPSLPEDTDVYGE